MIENTFGTGDTSLKEDQPGETFAPSKSSMNASACEFVRMRVALFAHTPVVGTPLVPPEELLPDATAPLEEPLLLGAIVPLEDPLLLGAIVPLEEPVGATPPDEPDVMTPGALAPVEPASGLSRGKYTADDPEHAALSCTALATNAIR
jgi:hypothetical protein